MAKDRRKLQHIHSSIPDRQPTPQTLEVGEIAVNNAAEKEFISLKNTDNKVVRISSDKQIITWMEKKEVMPYSGTVDNIHLDTNRSNIEIKLNQVVAKNTAKYDVVNGAKDIDGNDVNPSSDGGLTNGAGFAIDMSRYAMIGANPSFSSITVTHQSNLSGATNISNGAGGSKLTITTTDVNSTNANWNETIANHTSKVTTEKESATTRTTVVGTENLTVSGTTTEQHTGNVTITNSANLTATTNGNEVELIKGNNYRDVDGNYSGTTGGTTTEVKTKAVSETNLDTTTITRAKAVTETDKADRELNVSGNSTTNVGGNVIENTTGTTNITRTDTVTENNGAALNINTTGVTTIKYTGATTISGSSLESTTIGSTTIQTNGNNTNVTIQATGTNGDVNVYAKDVLTATGNTIVVNGAASISAKTPTTYISGTTLEAKETNINLSAATGTNISGGTFTSTSTGNTTLNASGNTAINTSGNTTVTTTGNTTIQSTASGSGVNIYAGSAGTATVTGKTIAITGTTESTVKAPTNTVSGTTTNVYGSTNLNATGATVTISGSSSLVEKAPAVSISGNSVNITGATSARTEAPTTEVVGSTKLNMSGVTSTLSGTTTNVYGATNLNATGATVIVSGSSASTLKAPTTTVSGGTTNVYGATTLTMTGATVNTTGTTLNTTGGTVNISGGTGGVNITGTTKFASETTINNNLNVTGNTKITGTTDISGKTTIDDDLDVTGNAKITGTTDISGKTTVDDDLDVTGALKVTGCISGNCVSAGTITAATDMRAGNVSANTISAATGIRANNVSANTITAATSANIPSITASTGVTAKTVSAETLTLATSASIPTISATTISAGTIHTSGLEGVLSWSYGDTSGKEGGSYNGSESSAITIPSDISHIANGVSTARTISTASGLTGGGNLSANRTIGLAATGTSGTYGPSEDVTGNEGNTIKIPQITTDVYGRVTSVTERTYTSKNSTYTVNNGTFSISGASTSVATFTANQSGNSSLIIAGGTNVTVTPDATNHKITISSTDTNTHRPIKVGGSEFLGNNTTALDLRGGTNVTVSTGTSGVVTIAATDTTYSAGDFLSLSNGSFSVSTGTSDTTVAVGNHTHDYSNTYAAKTHNHDGRYLKLDGGGTVSGDVTANAFFASSDERLKENINDVNYEKLVNAKNVKVKYFNFKEDESKRTVIGVIAQDVEAANLDYLVSEREDGFKAVDYTGLSLLKIAYLEDKIRKLENMINQLMENKQ